MVLETMRSTKIPQFKKSHSLDALPPKLPPMKRDDGQYVYPPLFLHPDPLATSLVARAGSSGELSEETLKAAMVLNATRIATIVRTWCPSTSTSPGQVTRQDFLDILTILGLPDQVAGEFFDKRLDSGGGRVLVPDLLTFVYGTSAAARGPGIGGVGVATSPTTSVRKRTSPERSGRSVGRAAAKPSANPSGGMHVAMELNVATLEGHLPMTIRAAMSGERRSSALTVAVPVAATASLPGSERFESPLPRSAIGPQILSEHKNNYHASFGHEKRACAASHVSAAAAAARSASSPRERRSPPQASERVPSSVYDLESYSPTQGGAKPAHGGGVGGPHVARHPSPAGVHGHADSSASSPLGGSPISGKSRKLNLPKFYSQRQGITLAELQAPVEPEIDSEIDAKAAEGGADEAGEPPKASLWAKGGLRAKIGALGKLAEAAQRDKEEAAVASDADRQRLLVAASEHVDDLVRILTEWDKEFRGDGRVTKRDFRRVLPLKNVFAERHVTDALFEFLVFEELKRQGKVSTEVREAEGGELIKQDMIVDKHGSGLAPSMAPAALAAAANIDLTHSTLEIWQLDRALRWAEGSRAKRSRLLTGKALEEVAMLQDNDKSVQQNLRDTLVNHALRVMDLFREWDADGNGEITKEEFRHALPMLGLHASYDDVEELFEGFDADSSGSISFRELNRQLRRDVKNERKAEKSKAEVVDLIDVTTLRQTVRQGLMAYANFRVDVHEDVDPITGMKRS